jgi:endonuclease YncB( thermonuclease family)
MVFGRDVTVDSRTKDRYGRTVAEVTLPDARSLNRELVKQGWCWWFRKYAPNDTVLSDLEASARKQPLGIWTDPQPVSPLEFRKAGAEQPGETENCTVIYPGPHHFRIGLSHESF